MKSLYLLLLAVLIGVELALGVLVAPVIFYPQSIIGDGVLTHFQSGQMMAQIFVKFNYFLLVVSIFALVYEVFFAATSKAKFALKLSSFMLALINLMIALSFIYYCTPYILQAQALGEAATKTTEFLQVHKASEYEMKLMMVIQLLLFFIKFPREARA
ncbi:DUF4149 domain-containing protein [Campylobacter sp.]|uniref:DUF4149 domain-containing protein n=1 Tax=Campylobacter sp. TaxID=205 RepID=UPI0026FE97D3|nr:DUF4149 domain-containing protein [Campylobacter sp.]